MGPCDVSWFPQSPVGVGGKGGHCIMLGYNMFCSTIVVLVRFDLVWFDLVLRMLMSGSDWGITVGGEGRVAGLVGHRGWGFGAMSAIDSRDGREGKANRHSTSTSAAQYVQCSTLGHSALHYRTVLALADYHRPPGENVRHVPARYLSSLTPQLKHPCKL